MAAMASTPGVTAPTPQELRTASSWTRSRVLAAEPFSFVYGGKASGELLGGWKHSESTHKLDVMRTEHTRVWRDPASGLEVTCACVAYSDFPAVEWKVTLRNDGPTDTPLLERLQGLDAAFQRRADAAEFVLHGNHGDYCAAESYEPFDLTLRAGEKHSFAPPGTGKSCDGPAGWPYFNLQTPEGGAILAIGWPGQWAAGFECDSGSSLRVTAGQQTTRLILHPGETIRTPLIAMLFYRGADIARSQNLWRRWYLAHVLPRVGGVPQGPISQIQVDGSEASTADVQAVLDAGIKPDICWRDAGGATTWYPNHTGPYKGNDSWLNTGTWDVDPGRYPKGFRPFSDWVRKHGMQFLLWFEPERAGDPNSWLGRNHPEWLLQGSSHGGILDEGCPEARAWLIDHIDGMIKTQGLDWYREDMNGVGPGPAWRKTDALDRQGYTENRYVQGHLAFWDALKERNPALRIDSCASGGRRNDLETMRRAVPLLRSDFQFPDMPGMVEGNQAHTWALSAWLPFQGSGCYYTDMYTLRTFYMAGFGGPGTSENVRRAYRECAQIAPMIMADYYPLTPYSRDADRWIGWQFNRPEQGDGAVQAFRRPKCAEPAITLKLRGLDPAATYEVTDFDGAPARTLTGKALMTEGLPVRIESAPGAALLTYRHAR
jgi:alpha-galactosidase